MIAWSRFHKLLARDASAFLIFFIFPREKAPKLVALLLHSNTAAA